MQKKQLSIGIIIGMVLYFVTSTVIELLAPQMDLVVRCVIMVAVALVASATVGAVRGVIRGVVRGAAQGTRRN